MKVGYVGLGKLGLPCAMAVEAAGHDVTGYDPDPRVKEMLATRVLPYVEAGAQELLDKTAVKVVSIADLVADRDLIFVAVQTPHQPQYEGTTRIPAERVDFDYAYLKQAASDLAASAAEQKREIAVVIISTVLPGTIEREIKPLLNDHVKICYSPQFIAMGTCIQDFRNPEFTLFGVDDPTVAAKACEFYRTLHSKPFYETTVKNAELIKVTYNTMIGLKIAFVNTVMEVCHKTGADVDAVTGALKLATDRLISGKYMSGGMGDGGGCHPRDNIALSWLSRKLDLSYDLFEALMMSREKQTVWFADLIQHYQGTPETPVVILGKSFKAESNIIVGSPAILLKNVLLERGIDATMYDPVIDGPAPSFASSIFFVGTKHAAFATMRFPIGSIIIDPWRYVPDQYGSAVVRIGEGSKP